MMEMEMEAAVEEEETAPSRSLRARKRRCRARRAAQAHCGDAQGGNNDHNVLMQLGLLPKTPTYAAKDSKKASSACDGNVLRELGLLPKPPPGQYGSAEHNFYGQGGWGHNSFFNSEMFCSSPNGNFVAEEALRTRQLPPVMCGTAEMPRGKSRSPGASSKILSGSSQLQNLLLALVLAKAEEKAQRDAEQQASHEGGVRTGRTETREERRSWSRTPSPEHEPPTEPQFSNFFQTQLLAIYKGIQAAHEHSPAPRKCSDHDEVFERSDHEFSNFFLSQLQAILSKADGEAMGEQDSPPTSPQSDSSHEYSELEFSSFFITQLQAIYPAVASVMQQGR
eukprot:TRINITY_DN95410_c0_g1_i1.p1 TRINITY_DN95410_c0_g1~~TRINITY_DN95410_c0_g1_i1.p1  ORF type:complete len:337 (-),score=55.40 TRINITY_DN95410_c0_g1_i1:15-1025(-)